MAGTYDGVLLVAFGGPASREEVRPFLDRVLKGAAVPAERIEEVVRHYEAVGGRSPLNEITFRQARALGEALAARGRSLPVHVGLRNARPFLAEALREMARAGVSRALGVVLSAHHSEASWDRYHETVADARAELGDAAPRVDFCGGWHDHPLFVETWSEQIRDCLASCPEGESREIPLVFTAHSIPMAMARRSPYVEQIRRSASLIAERLGRHGWTLAYQSRSGHPAEPWLEPDIRQVVRELAARGFSRAVAAPIGFVADHVEVLYDLDIEAKKIAAACGLELLRAPCPNDRPLFIEMLADVVSRSLSASAVP
ncbi:MAG TPA: ferrochelatase [candidate division Zixibacteria bacterium]|nr:ferrochelatase [candidate division Zixibacteria bacterium]